MGYPNEAERRRLERFPDRIAAEDLRACFALSDRDRVLIFEQRGPENRLGLAVSLCALRFMGFVPDDIASIPDEALAFVSGQVDAAPHELLTYGTRAQTRSDHLQLVLTQRHPRRLPAPAAARRALGHRALLKLRRTTLRGPRARRRRGRDGSRVWVSARRAEPRQLGLRPVQPVRHEGRFRRRTRSAVTPLVSAPSGSTARRTGADPRAGHVRATRGCALARVSSRVHRPRRRA